MRKIWILLILMLSLSACSSTTSKSPEPPSLVTEVSVSYHYGDMHLRRHYTDTRKIDVVLYYLYNLSPYGTPQEDPEQIWGDNCRIILTESDGSQHIYRQQGGRYLSVDNHPWKKISESKSASLFSLLMNMESDL